MKYMRLKGLEGLIIDFPQKHSSMLTSFAVLFTFGRIGLRLSSTMKFAVYKKLSLTDSDTHTEHF